jgi:hypothetical protein
MKFSVGINHSSSDTVRLHWTDCAALDCSQRGGRRAGRWEVRWRVGGSREVRRGEEGGGGICGSRGVTHTSSLSVPVPVPVPVLCYVVLFCYFYK